MKHLRNLPLNSKLDDTLLPVALWQHEKDNYGCEFGCKMKEGDVLFGTDDEREPKFCANCFFLKVVSGDGKDNYKLVAYNN